MIKGVKTVELYKDGKHGVAKRYGDVKMQLYGDGINDGCYVSGLRKDLYERRFQLTSSERAIVEKLAKELVADKKHDTYTLDLVKGTITKSKEDW